MATDTAATEHPVILAIMGHSIGVAEHAIGSMIQDGLTEGSVDPRAHFGTAWIIGFDDGLRVALSLGPGPVGLLLRILEMDMDATTSRLDSAKVLDEGTTNLIAAVRKALAL